MKKPKLSRELSVPPSKPIMWMVVQNPPLVIGPHRTWFAARREAASITGKEPSTLRILPAEEGAHG